jgi:hypothetical protein
MTEAEQMVHDLRRRTRDLVDRKDKPIRRDELASKAGVSYFWLCRYLAEHDDAGNPRMKTISKLEKCVRALERSQ